MDGCDYNVTQEFMPYECISLKLTVFLCKSFVYDSVLYTAKDILIDKYIVQSSVRYSYIFDEY